MTVSNSTISLPPVVRVYLSEATVSPYFIVIPDGDLEGFKSLPDHSQLEFVSSHIKKCIRSNLSLEGVSVTGEIILGDIHSLKVMDSQVIPSPF